MTVTLSQIQELESVIGQVPAGQQDFARKLCRDFRKYGDLFPKKAYWVGELIRIAKSAKTADGQVEARPTVDVGSMAGVIALFDKAAGKGKNPAIVLALKAADERVLEFKLGIAGARAFSPGSINVTDNRPYGSNTWFGRIYRDGRFEPSPRAELPDGLVALLERFAANPAKVATEQGRLTNRCCFCNTQLTDAQRSTKVGFGETCAKRYGLHDDWKAAKKQAAFATEHKHEGCRHGTQQAA